MRRRKLLLVEDDAEIRELIRLTLEPLRLQIHEAVAVADAWVLIKTQRPGMVLLDMNLETQRDGLALCQRIKQAPACAGIKVIIVSTASQAEDLHRGAMAGADLYIVKPFSPAQLLDSVRAQLAL